ncbi:MAG: helix-turn-helix transcriptional regulator [Aeromicrobium sp.]
MGSSQLTGNLDLLLLAVLTEGEAHGYAVINRVREQSDGEFDLAEGTVYPALHRLEADGLLSSRWQKDSGRRRRTYSLTAPGRVALATKRHEWHRFTIGVHSVIGATT